MTPPKPAIPYKIASLCEIRDHDDRILLLHRTRPPNRHLYSPIGGKLEQRLGESPTACAIREIHEEVGLRLTADHLHLLGVISETAYQPEPNHLPNHWLMFWFRVIPAVNPADIPPAFDEGALEWFTESDLKRLPLPDTDRLAIWPAVLEHSSPTHSGFFALHLDCSAGAPVATLEQSILPKRHDATTAPATDHP